MEISYLHEFAVLAENGNYLDASEELFISQSSLSKHIKTLEKELGVSLFDRTTRSVHLSEYGELLLPYARQIAELQAQYTASLASSAQDKQVALRVGSIPMLSSYRITDQILRFKGENPNVSVQMLEGESKQLLEMLRRKKCDLAFIRSSGEPGPAEDAEFVRLPYASDRLVAILPAGHPLAQRTQLRLAELRQEPLLLLNRHSVLYDLCVSHCQQAGFTPRVAYSGTRAENILSLIGQGMGIGLLMRRPIEGLIGDGLVLVDIEPRIETRVQICYCRGARLSPEARRFVAQLRADGPA